MVCTCSKLLAMAIITFVGIGFLITGYSTGRKNFSNLFDPKPLESLDWKKLTLGFYQVMWPFLGWNVSSYVCEEMEKPGRNVPLATVVAVGMVTIAYIGINVGFFAVLTPEEMLSSQAVAATFATKVFGRFYWILPLLVCICIIGSFCTDVIVISRANFVAARRGLLPQIFSMAHIHQYSPSAATILSYLICIILICVGEFDGMMESLGFVTWTFFGLNASSVLILRRQYPNLPRPFKVPTLIPILVVGISIFFVLSPILRNPTPLYFYSLIFFGIGMLVYYIFIYRQWKPPGIDNVTLFCQKLFQLAKTDWESVLDKQ